MEAHSATGHAKPAGTVPPLMSASQQRLYLIIGGVLLAVGLVVGFVIMSGSRKETFASRALDQARNVAESGNLPLAASELQKVISTYGGTRAAQEAVISLNTVRLINGQHEIAAVDLQQFLNGNPDPQYRAPAYGLLGRALENAKRSAEAAEAYASASSAADVGYLKAEFLLDAGRAYASAGAREKAIESYRRVLRDYPKTPSKTEAEVRLAELTGGAM